MFKLVSVFAVLAVAAAAPHQTAWHSAPVEHVVLTAPSHTTYQHVSGVAEVGKIIEHVPTSVSHSSSSVVHEHAAHITPVVAPVHKTVVHSVPVHHEQQVLVHSAPVHQEQHQVLVHSAPVHHEHQQVLVHSAPAHHQVHHHEQVLVAAPVHTTYSHHVGVAEVGKIVEHVPTSVSHSSSSVIHGHGSIVTPVVAPVHKTVVHSVPVHQTYVAAPVHHHSSHPVVYSSAPQVHSW